MGAGRVLAPWPPCGLCHKCATIEVKGEGDTPPDQVPKEDHMFEFMQKVNNNINAILAENAADLEDQRIAMMDAAEDALRRQSIARSRNASMSEQDARGVEVNMYMAALNRIDDQMFA